MADGAPRKRVGWVRGQVLCLVAALLLAGCATTNGAGGGVDPWEPMNRRFAVFNRTADRYVMAPVAHTYIKVMPRPLRSAFTHFFRNVAYPGVIVNDILQGRLRQSASDIGRFVVNSTVGMLGLFDIARHVGLKAHKEDMGMTLAHWGVGQGPYLVLPFVGPDTLRNTPSLLVSVVTNMMYYTGSATFTAPLAVLDVINTRANANASLRYVHENAVDAYVFTRSAYLQHRNFLIHGGHLPLKTIEEMMLPPMTAPTGPPAPAQPVPPDHHHTKAGVRPSASRSPP
ncbi:MAG TPA: VacJ family lipoprotein [Acidiferrobacter sp.]|nr:VacJ family lipoprotein [Acidiferrobacter sp.]